jgi:hypothetical protein
MKFVPGLWLLLEWLVWLVVVQMTANTNDWLSAFVAGTITGVSYLSRQVADFKLLYNITDAQLVSVSSQADELRAEIDELRARLDEIEHRAVMHGQ